MLVAVEFMIRPISFLCLCLHLILLMSKIVSYPLFEIIFYSY